jgi:hypothetical protein
MEVQTQLLIAKALSFGSDDQISGAQALSEETGRMIAAMLRRLSIDPAG